MDFLFWKRFGNDEAAGDYIASHLFFIRGIRLIRGNKSGLRLRALMVRGGPISGEIDYEEQIGKRLRTESGEGMGEGFWLALCRPGLERGNPLPCACGLVLKERIGRECPICEGIGDGVGRYFVPVGGRCSKTPIHAGVL